MGVYAAIHRAGLRRRVGIGAVATLVASAACSFILDHDASQCQTDGDCAKFGGRPSCQGGVCIDLMQGPKDCFSGSPTQPNDFANQCSAAECLAFDDCARLGLCGSADPPMPVPPPAVEAGAASDAGAAADAEVPMQNCMDPTQGRSKVVYITGSSNFPPLLSKLAPIINGNGYTPVFLVTNSCNGVRSMLSTTMSDRTIKDPPKGSPLTSYAQYFDANMNAVPCLLGGTPTVDVGESDIFSEDCPTFMPASQYPNITESFGPTQAMAFIVNAQSPEVAISEAAAREVFGLGGNVNASPAPSQPIPWTQPARFFIRNSGTGTQQMIGHAIGLSAAAFWGVDTGTAQRVFNDVRALAGNDAKQGIGIISVDYYDGDRSNLRALAYRASNQECAYLPDSDDRSFDKRNVRDGHYPIWGPLHFFSNPTSDAAPALLNVASGTNLDPDIINAFIGASLIPLCAMNVQRDSEIGDLSPYAPATMCGCYFEYQSAMTHNVPPQLPTGCAQCGQGFPPCPSDRPACNLGFCEVQ